MAMEKPQTLDFTVKIVGFAAFLSRSPSRARTYNNSVNSRVLYH